MPEELCKWCDVNEHKGKQLQDYEYKMCHKDESYRYSLPGQLLTGVLTCCTDSFRTCTCMYSYIMYSLIAHKHIGFTSTQFRCTNGQCIPSSTYLHNYAFTHFHICKHLGCNSTQFRCASGECIPIITRCGGVRTCSDGSDERNCSKFCCCAT